MAYESLDLKNRPLSIQKILHLPTYSIAQEPLESYDRHLTRVLFSNSILFGG